MKKPTKVERVLEQFVLGRKLHRFDAFALRDTCLHTTVSDLTHKGGLIFNRKTVQVNRQGDKVSVKLYWLAEPSLAEAETLLFDMKKRRRAI